MDCLELLEGQHQEVASLFKKFEKASDSDQKRQLFTQIADDLAAHATMEERLFYPAVRAKRTEDILLESLEEHLAIKRVLADLLELEVDDDTFDAKMKVLREEVEHHVEEEENQLFPKVKRVIHKEEREELGVRMEELFLMLKSGEPRFQVSSETEEAAKL